MENLLIVILLLASSCVIVFGLIRLFGYSFLEKQLFSIIEFLVVEAEKYFIETSGMGREKFEMVVNKFYNMQLVIKVFGKPIKISASIFITKEKLYQIIEECVDDLENLLEKYKENENK